MDIPDLSVESINVSKILAAHAITLPLVKLRQDEAMYPYNILNIFNSHHTDPIVMPCGSKAEGLAMLTGCTYLSSSDEDFIIFDNDFKVCEEKCEIIDQGLSHPMQFPIRRIPDATCPGYAKLMMSPISTELTELKKYCEFNGQNCFLKNSLKEKNINDFIGKYPYIVHGPALKVENSQTTTFSYKSERISSKKFEFKTKDFVLCLRGQSWPTEASEWKTRERSCDWPSDELFDNIINSGYFLAGVGSKESKENGLQWRVSFNRAEQLIIASFNETQIQCLILLKLLKGSKLSKLAGKSITSYTMKNLMFWCLEERSNEFWQPSNLLCCLCFCLTKLKSFVENKFQPDYFIKERNHFISTEFTHDVQSHLNEFLQSFLKDPRLWIGNLLSSYKLNYMHLGKSISTLVELGQKVFISDWLCIRISMAEDFHGLFEKSFSVLYDGYNIENILLRCNDVLKKLTNIDYAQPFIKLVQNCMGVLQYILLKKEMEISGQITDSDTQRQPDMGSILEVDLTHTPLRIATCDLDEGGNKRNRCIDLIRLVTKHQYSNMYMQTYSDVVKQILKKFKIQIHAPDKKEPLCIESEITIYNEIISHDLKYQDPYRTSEIFKHLENQKEQADWSSEFYFVWRRCWFYVTFMAAELPVLPKPAALELCNDHSQKKICFQPFLFGLLLEFLWHAKYSSTKEEGVKVLNKMKSSFEIIPHQQQSSVLNFITYCCTLINDYRSAARYLIRSFNLNPVSKNVAYLYIKYIIKLLGLTFSDNVDDRSLWLNLLEIDWNID